jgi:hypothetical protein
VGWGVGGILALVFGIVIHKYLDQVTLGPMGPLGLESVTRWASWHLLLTV